VSLPARGKAMRKSPARGEYGERPHAAQQKRTAQRLDAYVRAIALVREKVKAFDSYPFNIPAITRWRRSSCTPRSPSSSGRTAAGSPRWPRPSPSRPVSTPRAAARTSTSPRGGRSRSFTSPSGSCAVCAGRRLGTSCAPRATSTSQPRSSGSTASPAGRPSSRPMAGSRSTSSRTASRFLALVQHRFSGNGFYVLDEPEAALSPQRQLFVPSLHATS